MKHKHRVYLGLGSNAPDAGMRIKNAVELISRIPGLTLDAFSTCYSTQPQDYVEQPWFKNQVIRIQAHKEWEPDSLLKRLLEIETALGRVRSSDPLLRFGPRVIDIDMLIFDRLRMPGPFCILPHPRLYQRAFWLVPLLEIAPQLEVSGVSVAVLLARLQWHAEGLKIFQ